MPELKQKLHEYGGTIKVKGYIDETQEIEVEILDELGRKARETIDRIQWETLCNGSSVAFASPWEDNFKEVGDEMCFTYAEREYHEMQEIWEEHPPISLGIGTATWQAWSSGVTLNEDWMPRMEYVCSS